MTKKSNQRGTFTRIISIIRSVPKGQVASYGQIAALAGYPKGARMVAWAMHTLSEKELAKTPWWRVLNRVGIISTTCQEHTGLMQKRLLEQEGVAVHQVKDVLQIDLQHYGWLRNKK